jgi:hypothetical protein
MAIASGILATWCIATLLYAWKGFDWLRVNTGVYGPYMTVHDPVTGKEHRIIMSFWGRVLNCFWCLSLIVGAVLTPVVLLEWRITIPFALAGGSMLLSKGGRTVWRLQEDG